MAKKKVKVKVKGGQIRFTRIMDMQNQTESSIWVNPSQIVFAEPLLVMKDDGTHKYQAVHICLPWDIRLNVRIDWEVYDRTIRAFNATHDLRGFQKYSEARSPQIEAIPVAEREVIEENNSDDSGAREDSSDRLGRSPQAN